MKLILQNIYTTVTEASAREKLWLRGYLAVKDKQAYFASKHGGRSEIPLYDIVKDRFPTGLYPLVKRMAPFEGFSIEMSDARIKPCEPMLDLLEGYKWEGEDFREYSLYEHQITTLKQIFRQGRGMVKATTGAGKGTSAIIMASLLECPVLFLAHRMHICEDIAKRFEVITGDKAGLIGEGKHSTERFTCASLQTLYARRKRDGYANWASQWGAVILDEAHTGSAWTFNSVMIRLPNAYYRIGFSGTPLDRSDRKSSIAVGALGPLICEIRFEELAAKNIVARPRITMISCHQESDKPKLQGVKGELVIRSSKRNKIIVDTAVKAERPILIFLEQIKHGNTLVKMLRKKGLEAEFISGKDKTPQRVAHLKRLERAELDVVVTNKVLQEGDLGVDSLRTLIDAGCGSSTIVTLQNIGRGMRLAEGKSEIVVYGIYDTGQKWLEKHSRARMLAYQREGHDVTVVGEEG